MIGITLLVILLVILIISVALAVTDIYLKENNKDLWNLLTGGKNEKASKSSRKSDRYNG